VSSKGTSLGLPSISSTNQVFKAISRRIVPETTGTRRGGFSGVNSTPRAVAEPQPQPNPPQPPAQPRYHMPDRHEQPRRASPRREAAIGVPPPVPGFGFQIPGMRSNY
jgi:protein NRD1